MPGAPLLLGMFSGMTSHLYQEALGALSDAQCQVVARGQLHAIGVPHNTISVRCRAGGPWQQPLPKVVVLHSGPLSVEQRCWAALCYAAARALRHGSLPPHEAVLSGEAALALHGVVRAAPHPADLGVIDVLVPHHCSVRSYRWVRISRTRRMPAESVPSAGTATELPLAPVARTLTDVIRVTTDVHRVRALIHAALREQAVRPDELERELRAARLTRRPDVATVLQEVGAGVRSGTEAAARSLIAGAGLPQPLWHEALLLDGVRLGTPDAYWPQHGVVLEIDDAQAAHRRHRLEGTGLHVIHASAWHIRGAQREFISLLRAALATGPHGPADRIVRRPH